MTDPSTFRALTALRDAPDRNAPGLMPAWRTVQRVLEGHARARHIGVPADRDEALGEALLKVVRGVAHAEPRDEAAARAWLRRIFDNTLFDLLRVKKRRKEVLDDGAVGERDRELAEQSYADSERGVETALDVRHLAVYEQMLWNRIDEHIEATVRRHARVNARRRAEVAYARIVRERSFDELERTTGGEVKRHTLYQWVHRGRDDALRPVAARWARDADPDTDEGALAAELAGILEQSVRADAGRPRGDPQREVPSEPP